MNILGQTLKARLENADALRMVALAVTLGFVGLVTLFVGGDAIADPGGWRGIGGTAALVLSMLGLSLLGLYRPRAAFVVLAVLACAPLVFGVWSLLDYDTVHTWEDNHGPLSLVLVMAICAPGAVAGLVRPHAAGYFILIVTVLPLLLAAVGAGSAFFEPLSTGLLLAPLVVSGVLFLLSGRQQTSPHPSPPLPSTPVVR